MKKFVILLLLATLATPVFAYKNIYANDGTYLGNTNNQYDPNSIYNQYGKYGSAYSPNSINNQYGKYGSESSPESPHNPYAQNGYEVDASDGDVTRYGDNECGDY